MTDVSVYPGPEGTVDTVKVTLLSDEVFTGEQNTAELIIDKSQVKSILEELKKAKKIMDELNLEWFYLLIKYYLTMIIEEVS